MNEITKDDQFTAPTTVLHKPDRLPAYTIRLAADMRITSQSVSLAAFQE